jgi:hypothetical protein
MGLLDEAIREHLELKRLRGADPTEIARLERDVLGSGRRGESYSQSFDAEPGLAPSHDVVADHAFSEDGVAPEDFGFLDDRDDGRDATPDRPLPHLDEESDQSPGTPTSGSHTVEGLGVLSSGTSPRIDEVHATFPIDEADPHEPGGLTAQDTAEFDVEAQHEDPRVGDAPPASEPEPEEPSHRVLATPPGRDRASAAEAERSQSDRAASGARAEPDAGDEDAAEEVEDVLEETPDFLQETPEHDRLWFEQQPPRDFDFDK